MSNTNRTMPASTMIPVLAYDDLHVAIEWLSRVFGFSVRWIAGDHRAQMCLEGGAIAVTRQPGPPPDGSLSTISIMVRVSDVTQHYERAQQHGAKILHAPIDFPYGERQYTVIDLNGYVWTFSQSIHDMVPEDWGAQSVNL
jgi:uncharacterized glyoxalase superfamily protein PhnB